MKPTRIIAIVSPFRWFLAGLLALGLAGCSSSNDDQATTAGRWTWSSIVPGPAAAAAGPREAGPREAGSKSAGPPTSTPEPGVRGHDHAVRIARRAWTFVTWHWQDRPA